MAEMRPNVTIHAVIGNNNMLENVNSCTNPYEDEILILRNENQDLKEALFIAKHQLRIKDVIINTILQLNL